MTAIFSIFLLVNSFTLSAYSNMELISEKGVEKMEECIKVDQEKSVRINVSVATLWKEPGINRELDLPSISNPADLGSWTTGMTNDDRLWLVGKIETQALLGHEVVVLQEKGDWVEVAVKGQYTAKNEKGYPGWMPKSQLVESNVNYQNCKLAIVNQNKSHLYNEDKESHFLEISFNTWLPIANIEDEWVGIYTPTNEVKYIKKAEVNLYTDANEIPKPTQDDLVETAKRFLGLHYLWAGMSAYGFDCSGFVYTVYRFHGIQIPRDASEQAKDGLIVAKEDLEPGDLLFFAYEEGKGRVHHVGMYVGDGKMIHSPNSAKSIEIISIDLSPYKEELIGGRRYLKEK